MQSYVNKDFLFTWSVFYPKHLEKSQHIEDYVYISISIMFIYRLLIFSSSANTCTHASMNELEGSLPLSIQRVVGRSSLCVSFFWGRALSLHESSESDAQLCVDLASPTLSECSPDSHSWLLQSWSGVLSWPCGLLLPRPRTCAPTASGDGPSLLLCFDLMHFF